MTPEKFKETFKVGERIMGYPTGRCYTITAIGLTKFLYMDGEKYESWSKMNASNANWRVPK